jgi:hypothetical protein
MILAVLAKGLGPDHLSLVLPLALPLEVEPYNGFINRQWTSQEDMSRTFARDACLDRRWKLLAMEQREVDLVEGSPDDLESARLCAASILMDDMYELHSFHNMR